MEINDFLLNKLDKLDTKLDQIKDQQVEFKVAFETHEERDKEIQNDVKTMGASVKDQSNLLADYNQSLREHMRRTSLLEAKVEPLHVKYTEDGVAAKLHSQRVKLALKVLGIIATLATIGAGIAQMLGML